MFSSPKIAGITLIAAPNKNRKINGAIMRFSLRIRRIASSLSVVKFLTDSKDETPGVRDTRFKAIAGIPKTKLATIEVTIKGMAGRKQSKNAPAVSILANRISTTPPI